ncbi:hypothetical protein LOD99_9519 [Oopsacas minuta]|uniref:Tesmin/TSO1-like CXC domain-containing protein n=1 Tax=Oopsacas minuta TaxID=111878 RepID=A0AAV7JBP5_9METZ|nr:hypothetical protein LOD99_9519 [Oopsacas minuta]
MSESGIPYRWLLVYQDHFTTFIQLRPLMNKGAEEVADFSFFNRKPSFGLSDLEIQSELASEIHDEADLENVIDEINNPDRSYMQSNGTNIISSETVPDFDLTPVDEVELPFQPQCIQDTYIDDISPPLPEGTRVFSSIPSSSTITTTTTTTTTTSFGIIEGSFCRCSNCKTNRCACKKSNRTCSTKCHPGKSVLISSSIKS